MAGPSPSPTPSAQPGVPVFSLPTGGGTPVGADSMDPLVLWSRTPVAPAGRTPDGAYDYHTRFENEFKAKAKDRDITTTEAVNNFWAWSDAQRAAFGKRLHSIGLIDDPANFQAMYAAWARAVDGAAASRAAGKPRTPWEVIDLWDGLSENHLDDDQKEPTTQTSYNTPSRQEAEAMIRQLFRDQVGRDPDEGELSKYRGMIIRKASDNPTVSRTVYDANGNATTTTSGGIDIQSEIQDLVQEDDDYGTFQAGTTYLNALMSALGAPV